MEVHYFFARLFNHSILAHPPALSTIIPLLGESDTIALGVERASVQSIVFPVRARFLMKQVTATGGKGLQTCSPFTTARFNEHNLLDQIVV